MNALDYLNSEKNLWHFVRSTNVNNNNDSVLCIYERHEQHLGNNFCETSVSEALMHILWTIVTGASFYGMIYMVFHR